MRMAVTGATGFLGSYVVAEALRGGHEVVAFARPEADVTRLSWHDHKTVDVVRQDLRRPNGLEDVVAGVDVVVHLAAVKSGDFSEQFAGTVVATENLLAAMEAADLRRLVLVSSFSVYDYHRLAAGDLLDETSPVEARPLDRDDYAQTKLLQEELVWHFADEGRGRITVVRPGLVYGRDNLWHACLGAEMGEAFLRIGGSGRMPLTYVENCAGAIVAAAERDEAVGQVVNVVDDDQPTRRRFIRALLAHDPAPPKVVPVSWRGLRALAGLAWWVDQRLLGGRALLPGLLVPVRLDARFGPLRYSNDRAKGLLGWTTTYGWEEAVARSAGDDDLLGV